MGRMGMTMTTTTGSGRAGERLREGVRQARTTVERDFFNVRLGVRASSVPFRPVPRCECVYFLSSFVLLCPLPVDATCHTVARPHLPCALQVNYCYSH